MTGYRDIQLSTDKRLVGKHAGSDIRVTISARLNHRKDEYDDLTRVLEIDTVTVAKTPDRIDVQAVQIQGKTFGLGQGDELPVTVFETYEQEIDDALHEHMSERGLSEGLV